jgi:hypothetical protein
MARQFLFQPCIHDKNNDRSAFLSPQNTYSNTTQHNTTQHNTCRHLALNLRVIYRKFLTTSDNGVQQRGAAGYNFEASPSRLAVLAVAPGRSSSTWRQQHLCRHTVTNRHHRLWQQWLLVDDQQPGLFYA